MKTRTLRRLFTTLGLTLLMVTALATTALAADHQYDSDGDGTLETTISSASWTGTSDASDLATAGKWYLTDNVSVSNATISISGDVYIDLNGFSITMTSSKSVFTVGASGTLRIFDGSANGTGIITGGKSSNGGGGVLLEYATSTFELYGGTISGNQSTGSGDGGGGVHTMYGGTFRMYDGAITGNTSNSINGGGVSVNGSDATFTMYGGTISGNSAARFGGGVYVTGGTFTMSGGTITGNTADSASSGNYKYGDGVYLYDGTLNLSGSPEIDDNDGDGLCVASSKYITIDGDGLESGAEIYVTSVSMPTTGTGNKVQISTNGSSADGAYFSTDDGYYVSYKDSYLYIVEGVDTGAFDVTDGTYGTDYTYADGVLTVLKATNGLSISGAGTVEVDETGTTFTTSSTSEITADGTYYTVTDVTYGGILFSELTILSSGDVTLPHEATFTVGGKTYTAGGMVSIEADTDGVGFTNTATLTCSGVTITAELPSSVSSEGIFTLITSSNGSSVKIDDCTITVPEDNIVTFDGSTFTLAEDSSLTVSGTVGDTIIAIDASKLSAGDTVAKGEDMTLSLSNFDITCPSNTYAVLDDDGNIELVAYPDDLPSGVTGDWTPLTSAGGSLDSGNYFLTADTTLDANLTIAGGETVNLYLNDKVLTGTGSASVITVSSGGALNLYDVETGTEKSVGSTTVTGGVITGGSAASGGVYVYGTFNMHGGNITGNTDSNYGAGVYVNELYAKFTMNGGTISGNTATRSGGGVYVNAGDFTMNGGTITGNICGTGSYNGGGVYVTGENSTFKVSGDASVTGNTKSDGTTASNVYLTSGKSVTVTDTLTGSIGVTSHTDNTTVITDDSSYDLTSDDVAKFSYDTTGYTILFNDDDTGVLTALASDPTGASDATLLTADTDLSSGTYYLGYDFAGDLTTSSSASITLYLNGQDLTGTVTVENSGSFTVADDVESTITIDASDLKADDIVVKAGSGVTLNLSDFTLTDLPTSTYADLDNSGNIVLVAYPTVEGLTFQPFTGTDGTLDAGNYFLTADTTLTADYLTINSGATVNLYLNDKVLTGHGNDRVIYIAGGTLNLYDTTDGTERTWYDDDNDGLWTLTGFGASMTTTGGVITGGVVGNWGGGVYVNSGTFTMNGGNIVGNKSTSIGGGGVSVTGGTFTMNGGTIAGNAATQNGGGVYVNSGTFTMNGGNIVGNTASTYGSGVYMNNGTFNVSGSPVITGNTNANV